MVTIDAGRLSALVSATFRAAGCDDAEAERIARYLVRANLTGHDSHGVIRVPRYLDWMADGWLRPGQNVTVVTDNAVMAVLDGNHGFGQTIGPQAVRIGIDKAAAQGASVIALRHSGHLGRIGEWAEMAVDAGLVSIHLVNVAGSLLVAPFGGAERRMATNPVAIGVPLPDRPPIVLDFATSMVAEGKALVAYDGGKPLPPNSLIDNDGNMTGDPAVFYGPRQPGKRADPRSGKGAIRAMGEHKGSGLSFLIELLAGAFTGSGCAGPGPRTVANGMLSIYLTPEAFDTEGGFADEVKRYIDFVKSAKPAEPDGEVLVPGEPERRARAARERDGVPLADETWRSIVAAARQAGVSEADIGAPAPAG